MTTIAIKNVTNYAEACMWLPTTGRRCIDAAPAGSDAFKSGNDGSDCDDVGQSSGTPVLAALAATACAGDPRVTSCTAASQTSCHSKPHPHPQ